MPGDGLTNSLTNDFDLRSSDCGWTMPPKSEWGTLTGQARIDWLYSLSGQTFDKMTDDERLEALSIVTDISPEEFKRLTDKETSVALQELNGVNKEEKLLVLKMLSGHSKDEAREAEGRIRLFLNQPFAKSRKISSKEKSSSWHLAEFALDYLRKYVKEGDKRKDGITEEIMHFFKPAEDLIRNIKDGTLPREIKQVKKLDSILKSASVHELPEAHRSMELALALLFVHDIVEDFTDVSVDSFKSYMIGRLDGLNLKEDDRKFQIEKIEFLCQAVKAITFKYKEIQSDGKIVIKSDHTSISQAPDLNIYAKHMLPIWIAALIKGGDRLDGITSRYAGHILQKDFFTIQQDNYYDNDTKAVFRHGRLLENLGKKFPELKSYIGRLNHKMEVSHRIFECLTANHPSNLTQEFNRNAKKDPVFIRIGKAVTTILARKFYNVNLPSSNGKNRIPETAPLYIADYLKKAVEDIDPRNPRSPILDLFYGARMESLRHPRLRRIVDQSGAQIRYFIPGVAPHAKAEAPDDENLADYLLAA